MINQRLVAAVFFFVFFIQADLLSLPQTICENNNGNYTSNSAYSANLNSILSHLSTNIGNDSFYNASAGQGADRVNAVAMCVGDLQLKDCRYCVETAGAELVKSCPNQKQAIRCNDVCTLRYSNASIYGVLATGPTYTSSNPQSVISPERFKANLKELLNDLRGKAAAGGGGAAPGKLAAGNRTGLDFQTIFGLVQCTPDLSSEDCSSCLVDAMSQIPGCCDGKKGGRVVSPSCNLRFETNPFFNETRLQELEFVPPPPPPPPQPSPPAPEKKSSNRTRTIIIIVVVVVVFLVLAVSAIIFLRKSKKHKPTVVNPQRVDEVITAESVRFDYSTIEAATNAFSDNNKLGQGGFGAVYRGTLSDGREIAVKRLSRDSGQGEREFQNEVLLLARLRHRNLVRLLGYAEEEEEKLLIYEFVENASLDRFIFGDSANRSNLDWDRRYRIVQGIARGIRYLHDDSRLRIIHRDLKASNILLDREMSPKIADFGIARLFGQDDTHVITTRVVGTHGYMPPEYVMHGECSIKLDVFSFGVLVLEIISGQKNHAITRREGVVENLGSFAWKRLQEGRHEDVVDPFLRSGLGSMNQMLRCIQIGLLCVQEDAAARPTMATVDLMLSSFSISLDLPLEPAFYASDASLTQQQESNNNSTNSEHRKSPGPAHHQSQTSSQNDSSITELQPR